jgi:endoglucanase
LLQSLYGLLLITFFAEKPAVLKHGQLSVEGSQLVNEKGKAIQLEGMSSHGLQLYGRYVNEESIKWLRDDWGIEVFRAAMYTDPGQNGHVRNKNLKNDVIRTVDAAIAHDIYVIIDWHILRDGDPNIYKEEAKLFFDEMSKLYGNYPNVIYEIANEPNGDAVTWDNHIKPYAEEIIPIIRANDPDNIIIVGTPSWSQHVHKAADNPLDFDNIMYTVHFYAGTHGQWLRDHIDYAMDKGLAIFVTEWGTSESSGDGGVFIEETNEWLEFLDRKQISWANWSLAPIEESSAALVKGVNMYGGWDPEKDLTESGRFVRKAILD